MILISAIPLKRGPLYNYNNKHFINPERIKIAQFDDHVLESESLVNVILDDNSEWQIDREVFDSMRQIERDWKW
jgi:hypothetical protein